MKKFLFVFLALLAAPAMADPVSAGFAIYSIYAGATAVAVTTAEMVVAGMMVAGGAMSLVGNVTGNQNLMKYGGIVSAVGGIGNMVNGAGSVASAAEEGGGMQLGAGPEGAGAVSSGVSGGSALPTDLPPDVVAPAVDTGAPQQGLIDSAYNDPSRALDVPGAQTPEAQAYSDPSRAMDTPTAEAYSDSSLGQDVTQNATQGTSIQANATQGTTPTQQDPLRVQETRAGVAGSDGSAPDVASGGKDLDHYLRQGTKFLRDNKEVTQIGGKMIQGAMDDKNRREAQQRIWDQEAQLRAQYNQSVAGSRVGQTFNRNVALGPRVPAPQPTPGA